MYMIIICIPMSCKVQGQSIEVNWIELMCFVECEIFIFYELFIKYNVCY